jgi:hypothetical protein
MATSKNEVHVFVSQRGGKVLVCDNNQFRCEANNSNYYTDVFMTVLFSSNNHLPKNNNSPPKKIAIWFIKTTKFSKF